MTKSSKSLISSEDIFAQCHPGFTLEGDQVVYTSSLDGATMKMKVGNIFIILAVHRMTVEEFLSDLPAVVPND